MKKFYKVLRNLPNIVNGWWNYCFPKKDIESLAAERAEHCKGCVYNVEVQFPKVADEKFPWLEGRQCGICGCPLPPKVRSRDEKCPIKKW